MYTKCSEHRETRFRQKCVTRMQTSIVQYCAELQQMLLDLKTFAQPLQSIVFIILIKCQTFVFNTNLYFNWNIIWCITVIVLYENNFLDAKQFEWKPY